VGVEPAGNVCTDFKPLSLFSVVSTVFRRRSYLDSESFLQTGRPTPGIMLESNKVDWEAAYQAVDHKLTSNTELKLNVDYISWCYIRL
jgi:hypothetical protein